MQTFKSCRVVAIIAEIIMLAAGMTMIKRRTRKHRRARTKVITAESWHDLEVCMGREKIRVETRERGNSQQPSLRQGIAPPKRGHSGPQRAMVRPGLQRAVPGDEGRDDQVDHPERRDDEVEDVGKGPHGAERRWHGRVFQCQSKIVRC